jgi:hypothetical protein
MPSIKPMGFVRIPKRSKPVLGFGCCVGVEDLTSFGVNGPTKLDGTTVLTGDGIGLLGLCIGRLGAGDCCGIGWLGLWGEEDVPYGVCTGGCVTDGDGGVCCGGSEPPCC